MGKDQEKENAPQLTAEQQKFNAIFYASSCALVLFKGPHFLVEMYNGKYQELYPKRNLLNQKLLEAVPELMNSKFPGILDRVYKTGENVVTVEEVAFILNTKTQVLEERYFDNSFSRISFDNESDYRILASPREVTDRVMTRKKLEASLQDLKEERELREKFVTSLSHDLRTPLSIAKISTQILQRKEPSPDLVKTITNKIVMNMERADRMIRDLLDANRIKAGVGIPLSVQECVLELIVAYVISDLEELYGKRFVIKNSASEVAGFWDQNAIHRIIENLVSNAIKYGSTEHPVTISLDKINDRIEIAIHNFGNPISSEDIKNLFSPYRRTEYALASGQKGWGIGLAMVKGLAEAHGGSLSLTSSLEAGTTFVVNLPIDARPEARILTKH